MAKVNKMNFKTVDDIDETEKDSDLDGIFDETLVKNTKKEVINIKLADLIDFANHPFSVRDDEDMAQLVESIAENGLIMPILVRPVGENKYEILAGHRRKHACELLGFTEISATIKEIDDDEAIAFMVDTNLSRSEILPSEKAFAYKMRFDAMRRKSGRKANGEAAKGRTVDVLSKILGESKSQVQRYIELTSLNKGILGFVDSKKITFSAAVKLCKIKNDNWLDWIEVCLKDEEELRQKRVVELKNKGVTLGIKQLENSPLLGEEQADKAILLITESDEFETQSEIMNDVRKIIVKSEIGENSEEQKVEKIPKYVGKRLNSAIHSLRDKLPENENVEEIMIKALEFYLENKENEEKNDDE